MKRFFIVGILLVFLCGLIFAEDMNVNVNLGIENIIAELKGAIESGKEIAPAILEKALAVYKARMVMQKGWAWGTIIAGIAITLIFLGIAIYDEEPCWLRGWIISFAPLITGMILFINRALILMKIDLFPEMFLAQKILHLIR